MRKILVIGAGRSSSSLIKYLLDKSTVENLQIIVADILKQTAEEKIQNHKNGVAIALDIFDNRSRTDAIKNADRFIF